MDPIERSIGTMGWWQIEIFIALSILKIPVGWHQLVFIFIGPPVEFSCKSPANTTHCSEECDEIVSDDSVFTRTIATQWNLICDKSYLVALSQTICMLGILTGTFLFGILADKYGRRHPLMIAIIIQLIASIGATYSPWFWLFCILRYLTALATGGTMTIGIVLVMEIIGAKWRELFSVLHLVPLNIAHLCLPMIAYFLRDWQDLHLAIAMPSVIFVSFYCVIPESPRWLLSEDRINEAADVLRKGAKRNGLSTENIDSALEQLTEDKQKEKINKKQSKANALDLIRTRNMLLKSIFVYFNRFVFGLYYYGVSHYISHCAGDIFVNVAISGGLGVAGTLLGYPCMKYVGRRRTLILSNSFAGIAVLSVAFISPKAEMLTVTLLTVGLLFMCITLPVIYLVSTELFPTVVRNVGVGIAAMTSKVGSMISPFVVGLKKTHPSLPPIVFGVTSLIGAVMIFWLPETLRVPLPETIDDAHKLEVKRKKVDANVVVS